MALPLGLRRGIVVAFFLLGASGARAQSWPSLSAPLPKAGGGEADTAVVVAVEHYAFLAEIPGAAQNGADWVDWLVRVRGVSSSKVRLLRDRQATRERIEQELKLAADGVGTGGTVWVVFIGHGAPSGDGSDGLFLGADTQPELESLVTRGLPQQEIVRRLAPTKSSLVVFDACFSGRTHDGKGPLVEGMQSTLPVRRKSTSGTAVLSSSETFAGPLPGAPRPAFSYLLLGALRGWGDGNHDGAVTVDEAVTFARDALLAGPSGSERLPSRRGGDGGLVLARGTTEEAPDLNAILLGRCPDDARWSGRRCEARCPKDAHWNGSACEANVGAVVCPSGTAWNGTACLSSLVACPAGTVWNGARCEGAPVDVAVAEPPSHVPEVHDAPATTTPATTTETMTETTTPAETPRENTLAATDILPGVAIAAGIGAGVALIAAASLGFVASDVNRHIAAGGYATGSDIEDAAALGNLANVSSGLLVVAGVAGLGVAGIAGLWSAMATEPESVP
jgi:hypothetical protein